jgi:hypothetical protein
MQRRELLKLMTGLPVGAAAANVDADDLALPAETGEHTSISQLMYLHPGELTFLMGRPSNGKTTLALSLALDYADAGKQVWYFSMARQSREAAEAVGLELRHMNGMEGAADRLNSTRQFFAYHHGQHVPINFFDHYFATHVSLPQVQHAAANLGVSRPDLVIYDADSIDCTTLTNLEEAGMATDLNRRRMECKQIFSAPILLTLGLPGGAAVERDDKRPLMEDLKPRRDLRPGKALVDELYFVYRPLIYEEDFASSKIDAIELTRGNRLRPDNHTRMLVRDEQKQRLRLPNHPEVERIMEWRS